MRRGVKAAAWALFALYGLIMLWLLFIRGRQPEMMSYFIGHGEYWKWVSWSVNLRPFHTIAEFLETLSTKEGYLARHAFVNLAGNVAMFVPLGVFLPLLNGAGAAARRFGGCGRPHFEPLRRVDRLSLRPARRQTAGQRG